MDFDDLFYHPSLTQVLTQGAKVDGFIEKDSFCDHPEPTAAEVGGPFPQMHCLPELLQWWPSSIQLCQSLSMGN